MSTNRDKNLDRMITLKIIHGSLINNHCDHEVGTNWLGHKLDSGADLLDRALLEGATFTELKRIRGASREHILHLEKEHGISCKVDGDKVRINRINLGVDQEKVLRDHANEEVTTSFEGSLSSYSWTVLSVDTATKLLDKSAFLHWGTGIPIAIRPFFIDREMTPGEKRSVTLIYEGKEYPAHVDLEANHTARTRLFWNSDFSSIMKSSFPYHHKQYSDNLEPESNIIIKFQRLDGYKKYQVTFAGEVSESTAINDIDAERLEDSGPKKEGGIKEYYGKRYERSPINRKKAILFHGLTCNVCDFNFETTYGARGADYIEVHHVKPISTFTEEQHVDPKTDLVTVCANCHRMMHRKPNDILSVDQVKNIIQEMK